MINIKPLPPKGLTLDNSIDVFHDWLGFCNDNGLGKPEFLVPQIRMDAELTEFSFLDRQPTLSPDEIKEALPKFEPWEYTLDLGGVETRAIDDVTRPEWTFHRFRVDLINQTLFRMFGDRMSDFDVLDIACHCGVFSLDMAARGVRSARGIDIRPENIAQANFLKDLYNVENCAF